MAGSSPTPKHPPVLPMSTYVKLNAPLRPWEPACDMQATDACYVRIREGQRYVQVRNVRVCRACWYAVEADMEETEQAEQEEQVV